MNSSSMLYDDSEYDFNDIQIFCYSMFLGGLTVISFSFGYVLSACIHKRDNQNYDEIQPLKAIAYV